MYPGDESVQAVGIGNGWSRDIWSQVYNNITEKVLDVDEERIDAKEG